MSQSNPVQPPNPAIRWGFGRPAHRRIADVLEAARPNYLQALSEIHKSKDILHTIPHDRPSGSMATPCWNNGMFTALDACALVGLLLSRKPQKYLEVGSGNSTLFARYAIEQGGLTTTIASIDPKPQADVDAICDLVIRRPLEDCDLSVFEQLSAGDLLFMDGSHRVAMNSDVILFFLEILPNLPSGVLVHVHDIFWPLDYPPEWVVRRYSEQYMLGMLLVAKTPSVKIILPNYFVCQDPWLRDITLSILRSPSGGRDIPFLNRNLPWLTGNSFWFETV